MPSSRRPTRSSGPRRRAAASRRAAPAGRAVDAGQRPRRAPGAARRPPRGRGCGQATSWPRPLAVVVRRRATRAAAPRRSASTILFFSTAGQPRAQRRAAAEAGAAGEDRLDHVVDGVLGERRVAQLAQREADQVGAVRDELGDRDRHDGALTAAGGGGVRAMQARQGGVHGGRSGERWRHCRAPDRADLAKDHASITSL